MFGRDMMLTMELADKTTVGLRQGQFGLGNTGVDVDSFMVYYSTLMLSILMVVYRHQRHSSRTCQVGQPSIRQVISWKI
jgi:uncharacterized membrane protein